MGQNHSGEFHFGPKVPERRALTQVSYVWGMRRGGKWRFISRKNPQPRSGLAFADMHDWNSDVCFGGRAGRLNAQKQRTAGILASRRSLLMYHFRISAYLQATPFNVKLAGMELAPL
jgi:hypothetical protein